MKTVRGKADYPLPADFGQLLWAAIQDQTAPRVVLGLISPEAMLRLRSEKPDPQGAPLFMAVIVDRLWLYPVPNGIYTVTVRYLPAEKGF